MPNTCLIGPESTLFLIDGLLTGALSAGFRAKTARSLSTTYGLAQPDSYLTAI